MGTSLSGYLLEIGVPLKWRASPSVPDLVILPARIARGAGSDWRKLLDLLGEAGTLTKNRRSGLSRGRGNVEPRSMTGSSAAGPAEHLMRAALGLFAVKDFARITLRNIQKASCFDAALICHSFKDQRNHFNAAVEFALAESLGRRHLGSTRQIPSRPFGRGCAVASAWRRTTAQSSVSCSSTRVHRAVVRDPTAPPAISIAARISTSRSATSPAAFPHSPCYNSAGCSLVSRRQ